jgi:hypothetical protein
LIFCRRQPGHKILSFAAHVGDLTTEPFQFREDIP